ncbi:MAG: crossover junction endodeoxyribonuclease RuvC [Micavibrio aeruginosavorus]|uniref:Crossover junction endodeoxyribonuclease RuvC n=1 Tax=Micavibrio aeruginosavorus TaxID=349221 RepID=A0A2W5FNZ9_9BACT|nr:MAG: crossover junction endodeoxyribonuclease RuvC [Micavibrio aeruginosavorus]
MRILGIDPGLEHTGWGVIDSAGSRISFVSAGVINTNPKSPIAGRLVKIDAELDKILKLWKPDMAAVEETFVNKNAASSLKLGQARGIALLVPARAGLDVAEYSTNLIKKSVVGNGHADKTQIGMMVRMLLPNCGEQALDACDALAVAICHAHHAQSNQMIHSALKGR